MGGRAAEEIVFGNKEITSGCGNDLEKATGITMNSLLSSILESDIFAAFHYKDLSERRKYEYDQKIQNFMFQSLSRSKSLLSKNRNLLDNLSKRLLEKDTLMADEIAQILNSSKKLA